MDDGAIPFELNTMSGAVNYRKAILREFEPYLGKTILEVGGGVGFFSEPLADRLSTERCCVIEPDASCREQIEKRCKKAEVWDGTAADLSQDEKFDSIVSINVLEHIEDDRAEFKIYREHLADDGFFCLFVPARTELFSPIDREFGHYRRYNKKALRHLLEEVGFEVVILHYFNWVGYVFWLLNFVLFRKKTFSSWMVRFNDRFVFPITRFLEKSIGTPLAGQSLMVVAQRKTH